MDRFLLQFVPDNTFQAYSGGIFNTNESCEGVINHAVVLVGWNDNNGTDGYWILRNSWGTSWGIGGYMHIAYGVSQVGYGANFIEYAGGTGPSSSSRLRTGPDRCLPNSSSQP